MNVAYYYSTMTNILVFGSTGLIGRHVKAIVDASANLSGYYPTRTDIANGKTFPDNTVDVVVCALGTTIKKAGSQEAFKAVDLNLVVQLANECRKREIQHFIVISAMSANESSAIFYNRVKGEMEESLRKMVFPRLTIIRPSLLIGTRSEFRLGEWIAQKFSSPVRACIPAKIRPIKASEIARFIVHIIPLKESGIRIVENKELHEL